MYQNFYKLDKEKQKRIINSSLQVFSINDFKHASTDDIAARAKISKGSLFQYFKNKQSLYIFLYDYALEVLGEKAKASFNFDETDYFALLCQSQQQKMALLEQYPYIYQFVIMAVSEKNPEIAKLVAAVNHIKEAEMTVDFFGNIDYRKFKAGTDIAKLTQMINWCSEGIWNEGVQQHLSMSEIYEQSLEIYDFYKKAVYKNEYLLGERHDAI